MKFLTAATALCLLTGLAVAQDQDKDRSLPRIVRVVGTGEVKVVPDEAVIEVGVEQQGATANGTKQSVDAAARGILAGLRANGVDEKDIQTNFLSLRPQLDYRKGNKLIGFSAAQTLIVTVRDLSRIDAVLESLLNAGGNEINSIQYQTSQPRRYRDQARDLAVKAAQEKAQALAKALGLEIGKVHSIEEVPEPAANSYMQTANASAFAYSVARNGPTTSAGQETISASIVVTFDLN